MAGAVLLSASDYVIPATPPVDQAVAANYERFANTQAALPATPGQPVVSGSPSRPGQGVYEGPITFTPDYQGGLNNTLGAGQAAMPAYGHASDAIFRPPGQVTYAHAKTYQLRPLGVGQHGPSSLGVEQTVALATVTRNPPQAGTIFSILSGNG